MKYICSSLILWSIVIFQVLGQQHNQLMTKIETINIMISPTGVPELKSFYSKESPGGPIHVIESEFNGRKCLVLQSYPFSGLRASRIFVYIEEENKVLRFRLTAIIWSVDKVKLNGDTNGWILRYNGKDALRILNSF